MHEIAFPNDIKTSGDFSVRRRLSSLLAFDIEEQCSGFDSALREVTN